MGKYKIFSLLLALTFLLTACAGTSGDAGSGAGASVGIVGGTSGADADADDGQSSTSMTDGDQGRGSTSATTTGHGSTTASGATVSTGTPADVDFSSTDSEMFTDRDYKADYDTGSSVTLKLQGSSVSGGGKGVSVSGTTILIENEGIYVLSGTLDDGMIVVNADKNDKVQLVLDSVSITSKTSAALYLLAADKVFVTLAEGSENTLENGGSFVAIDDNSIDGAIYSKVDVTFNGSGSLSVVSPAGHGVVCKDDLVFTGGTYTVSSASHGLDVNDSLRFAGAKLTVDAGKDGIHVENTEDTTLGYVYVSGGTMKLEAEGDGISASAYAQIEGGSLDILAGGGSKNGESHSSGNYGGFGGMGGGRPGGRTPSSSSSTTDDSTSMKGIKAAGSLLISAGTLVIDSADDSIHSNGSVIINGGTFTVASGDDGIHADENLTITAGTITISESYEGLEALDIKVSGGKITLTATDDGLNAAGGTDSSGSGGRDNGMFGGMWGGSSSSKGSVVISGGELYVKASGDGIDANGTLEITGGYTVVVGPTQGDTATLDYDTSAVISGGTFIGTGASGMAQTFSESKNQGVVAVSVGNQSAGTKIQLTDASGKALVSYTPELSFGVVILSSPDIEKGETYTITVGTASADFEAS